ncbi:ribose-phosphate diphosphokinase [Azohydromonas caseinilytica]|uniref:ribose-phosphate diphosphokinase n=1 Tax=Azohydromonas caseinilytica TaxID=2728836 RepID=A0A848FGC9_9BURK|nr:ribose-phosphate diphosphokinase [Azohydromonas caseinilytica]NML18196.1 ribose-phosphate pyrophosphokinase [Azohydromonas caseinilytica]
MLMFSLDTEGTLAAELAAGLDLELAPHEERRFEDGERKLRPLCDPRGDDVYVVHGLHGDATDSPHDKLCALLMFIATLRDHGAARVSAVLPYLAYARKDRRTKPFDPVNQRYVAQLLEAVGTAQVFVLEAHNVAALQNAFRIPVIHLEAHHAFASAAQPHHAEPLAVASPDPGGVKRAQLWREDLEARLERPVGFAMIDKRRSAGIVSSLDLVAGDVQGATVLLLDDLIASGGTLVRAVRALRGAGARRVLAFAAHGLFIGDAPQALAEPAIERVVVTDSVPTLRVPPDGALRHKLEIASCVPLLSQAIRDSHASWSR